METFTWIGGTSDWEDPANWAPSSGPPGGGAIAEADSPAVIFGTGSAAQFQTTNQSGLVTLAGVFNIGTIFNGAEMTLDGSIDSQFIETFVSLQITGEITASASLSVPDNGILQGNGAVTIENGASVDASSYTMNYIPGSLVPPPPDVSSLTVDGGDGGATLDIATPAIVNASNGITGGFGMLTAGTVDVINDGSIVTTYLSIEDIGDRMVVDASLLQVTQTTTDPNGVAGIQILDGELEVQDHGLLDATFIALDAADAGDLVVDNATLDVHAPPDGFNGISITAGAVAFQNGATVSTTQLYMGDDPVTGTSLKVTASSLDITGTEDVPGFSFSGLWLAGGSTFIGKGAQVTTPTLEVDGVATTDPTDVFTSVTIDGASTVSVAGDVLLGVTDGSSVLFDVEGADTQMLFGGTLILAGGAGGTVGAIVTLEINTGGVVMADSAADAPGNLVVGASEADAGEVDVGDTGSELAVKDATVGDAGGGTLFAVADGSIDVSGTLELGAASTGDGELRIAGLDGPGHVSVGGDLIAGDEGTGTIDLSSTNGLNSGDLSVGGTVVLGSLSGAHGALNGNGGTFDIQGDLFVGGEGLGDVILGGTDLKIDGDLFIANGGDNTGDGTAASSVFFNDVTLDLTGSLVVGSSGRGNLDWGSSLGQATSLDSVVIGDDADGVGDFSLHDATTALSIGTLIVGFEGMGTFDVGNGAAVEVTGPAAIADQAGSTGTVSVGFGIDPVAGTLFATPGASIVFDQNLFIGGGGEGTLDVGNDTNANDGGLVQVKGDLTIGADTSASGHVTVANQFVDAQGTTVASLLTVDGDIFLGTAPIDQADTSVFAAGTLDVVDGALFQALGTDHGLVDIAQGDGSSGEVNVNDGTVEANTLVVGDEGDGLLSVVDGTVTVTGDIVVGDSAQSTGTVDVEGDALLRSDGNMIVGAGATPIVQPGTIIYAAVLDATLGATIENDATGNDGFVIGFDAGSLGEAIIDSATLEVNDATIGEDGSGVLEILSSSSATFNGDLVLGDGTAAFGGMDVNFSDVDFFGTLDVGSGATGATVNGAFIPGGLLTIENLSSVVDQNGGGIEIGVGDGASGQTIVDDSELDASFLVIGDDGSGTLTVSNHGTVAVDPDQSVEIASGPSSSGSVSVDDSDLIFGSELDVGSGGAGTLSITNHGTVGPDQGAEDADVFIGGDSLAAGSATVDNALLLTGTITVGDAGAGSLTVQNGGTVDTAGDAIIGSEGSDFGESGAGTVNVNGLGGVPNDTLWKIAGQLIVGDFGHGTLSVLDGATVTVADEFDVGDDSNGFTDVGAGYVNEFGNNSLIEANSSLFVGGDGTGTLAVAGGAVFVAADDATLGDGINSAGSLLIAGGTYRQTGGDMVVGEQGTGLVQVNFGGDFNAGTSAVTLGDTDLGKGTINLVTLGSGNPTAETGDLTVGEEGSGTVSVTGNGLFATSGDAVIGDTGSGNVTINGLNAAGTLDPATWNISGDLSIGGLTTGGGGAGTLTVANNGVVHVGGELVQWNLGTIIDNSATAGLIEVGGTTLTSGSGIVIDAAIAATASHAAVPQGTLSGGGTIKANILDNGLVDLTNGQTLVIDGSVTGNGTLLLDGTAVMLVQGAIASTVTIDFQTPPGQSDVLELDTPLAVQGTIHDMGAGDAIDLPGVQFSAAGFSVSNDVLTITNNGSAVANLALNGNYTTGSFSLQKDGSGDANIVFGNSPVGTPELTVPAELPAWPTSSQSYLIGSSGIYVADPDAPPNATYTLTVNDKTGTMFVLFGFTTTQTDTAGSSPIVFKGSLTDIQNDLNHLIWESGGSAFAGVAAPPDTITASLVRGDGSTVTGAIGYDPAKPDASIIDAGPTTVALGQALPLSFVPSDPIASYPGNDIFFLSLNTYGNNFANPFNGYLVEIGQGPQFDQLQGNGQVTTSYNPLGEDSLAVTANSLTGGNLLFVPTATGTVPIDGSFQDVSGSPTPTNPTTANFSFNITVTAPTRTKAVTDGWLAAAGVLSTAANWSQDFDPGTIDTAVFTPIAGTPVIATSGGGVAGAWDIDASTTFAGVVDATGRTAGAAFDIDQGATATFLNGSALFAASLFNGNIQGEPLTAIRGNPVIVGDTTPSTLFATGANLYTGEVTIGNNASAGGSRMTVVNSFWTPDGNTVTGNPGDVLVGNNGYGVLTLINSFVDNVEAQNYQAAGFGQIQIGQDYPNGNHSGGLGVFFDSLIEDSVQVGFFGQGELAMSGGQLGDALNIQFVSLAVDGGRVDWGGGVELDIVTGLAGNAQASISGGVISGEDWTIKGDGASGVLTNGGTIDVAAGGASTIQGIHVGGTGTILLEAGATLDLLPGTAAPIVISAGQTIVFAPEFNGLGGLLTIGEPGDFAGTIDAFAAGDRIAVPSGVQTPAVTSATYDAANNTTAVDIAITEAGSVSFGGAITFGGSLSVGNFALDPVAPAGDTVFDYVEAGVKAQPLIISAPGDMAATDGVANPIPGLSLADENAAGNSGIVTLTLTPVSAPAGTFSAPAAAGLTIIGNDTQTITLAGSLAVVQAELTKIGFTPVAGSDEYIQATASDRVAVAAPLTFLAHNSAPGLTSGFTGTENYVYAGPATGSFDAPGVWHDGSGHTFPSGPGIADSATIVSDPLTGGEDVLGGIGVAGQLLTGGLVVLTGSLTLAGLGIAGVGTVEGSGPAFAGALEAGQGNLILAGGSKLGLGGDLIVTGELDSITDNPWSVAGNVHVDGGILALGGNGALGVSGTVEVGGTIGNGGVALGGTLDIIGKTSTPVGAPALLTSAAAIIGMGAGTSVADVNDNGFGGGSEGVVSWAIAGALIAGASGDAVVTLDAGNNTTKGIELSAATVAVGQSAGVSATVSVVNSATMTVATHLTVGNAGTGTLDVAYGSSYGAQVLVGSTAEAGEIDVGAAAGGAGLIDISLGGTFDVAGSAYLGGSSAGASGGTGTLQVNGVQGEDISYFAPAGQFEASGALTIFSGSGMRLREGTAEMASLTIAAGGTLSGDGFVSGPGTAPGGITGTNVTIFNTVAPLTTILDDGLIDADVDPGNGVGLLSLYGSISGTGTLEIEAGATVDIQGSVASTLHIVFNGPGAELILSEPGSFASVIGGFQESDALRLSNVTPGVVAYNSATGLLTDTVGGTVYTFTFDPPSGAFSAISDTHDGTLLELTAGPVISVPATVAVGVGESSPIPGVSLTGTSTETGDSFTIALSDNSGLLTATGAGVSGSDTKSLTIAGSLSDIKAALLTLHDTDSMTPSDTITVTAADVTQSIAAPAQSIAVTVNGIPAIAVPGTQTFFQGTPTSISGIALSESGDTSNETFTVTLTDATGSLAVIGASGVTVNGSGSNDLSISGALTDVNNALNADLSDTGTSPGSNPITVNATDSFGNGATPRTVAVTVEALVPVISVPSTPVVVSAGAATDITGVTLSEANASATETFTVTLTDGNGLLSATASGGATVGGGGKTLTIGGVLTDVNATLGSLMDTDGTTPSDTIDVNATDQFGNTASQQAIGVTVSNGSTLAGQIVLAGAAANLPLSGSTEVASFTDSNTSDTAATFTAMIDWGDGTIAAGTISGANGSFQVDGGHDYLSAGTVVVEVTITNGQNSAQLPLTGSLVVNGPPVITPPPAVTIGDDKLSDINGGTLSETGNPITGDYTLSVTDSNGLLSTSDAGGATVVGTGLTNLTITGSLSDVNTGLAHLQDIDASPGTDVLTLSATDGFGDTAVEQTTTVTVNGPPVITPPPSVIIGDDQLSDINGGTLSEAGNPIAGEFTLSVSDSAGRLSISDAGGATVDGSGSTHLTITGSLSDVNTGLAHLQDTDAAPGPDTLTLSATDGFGETALEQTTTVTVNGPPVIAPPPSVTIGDDQLSNINGGTLSETGNPIAGEFTLSVSDSTGQLSTSDAGGATVQGADSTHLTITGSLNDVNTGLAHLQDIDASLGSDTLTLSATDGFGETALEQTTTVTVNGPPVIAPPPSVTIGDDQLSDINGGTLSETGNPITGEFTLSVSDSTGQLSTSDAGGATVDGSGTTNLTLTGSLTDVNTGLAHLQDTDAAPGTDTLTLTATDGFGNAAAQQTTTVTVSASVPQLAGAIVLAAATAGTPLPGTTEVASFTDTDQSDTPATLTASIDWGDGTPVTAATITGAGGSFTIDGGHTYAEPGDFTLIVAIADPGDGAQLPLTGTLTASDGNVLAGQGISFATNTGEPFSGVVATFTDADTITPASDFTATIDWGDGTTTAGTIAGSDGAFNVSGEHTYVTSGEDQVTVTLTEVAPGTANATATGTADVVPQLAGAIVLGAATEDVPLPAATPVATFTDTDTTDTAGTFNASIDWGDGTVSAGTVTGSDGAFAVDGGHTYAENGGFPLDVTITDTENDARLTLTGTVAAADGNVLSGRGVTFNTTAGAALSGAVAAFSDTDLVTAASDLAASINWGDGTVTPGTVSGGDGSFAVSGTHTYASPGQDTIMVTLSDAPPGTASANASSTANVGQVFMLTKGVDTESGGAGDNVLDATTNSLSAGDQINGGAGGTNVLNLIGAGLFNLSLPASLSNIAVINAEEGQAAYAGGDQSFAATNQVITLRAGMNVTVDVSPAVLNPANPKPATITVNGANDASVINLAGGNDTVTVGGAAETVHGGSSNDQIQVTANTIGATIDGGSGESTLTVTGGGTVMMGTSVTDISSVLLATTPNALSFIANGIPGLVVTDDSLGADTLMAGGLNQTLTGGSGHELFVGFSGGATTFKDTAAAFTGDTISGFLSAGDRIDFTNVGFASLSKGFTENASGTAGALNVTDGSNAAAVTLSGSFVPANFHAAPDSGVGTLITYG